MDSQQGLHRVFFALWPDAELRQQFSSLMSYFPANQGRGIAGSNLHITLNFIGSVSKDQLEVYQNAAEDIEARCFELLLDRFTYFARSRVLCLALGQRSPGLHDLVKSLNKVLRRYGYKPDKRPYNPHITLFRNARPLTGVPDFKAIKWRITGFVLVESLLQKPPVSYQVLKEYTFAD